MIEHLRGTLIAKEPGHVVVECGGVGYGLEVPHTTFQALPAEGAEARLLVHFQMRESEIALFGFSTTQERQLFRIALGVPSIGPKLALVLLSTLTTAELIRAVREGDMALLTSVPGIGKRTAERLVVELREPLARIAGSLVSELPLEETEGELIPGLTREMRDKAVQSLIALGTKPAVAARAVSKAARQLAEEPSVEALVKEGLKQR